jgi:hypothetical protein
MVCILPTTAEQAQGRNPTIQVLLHIQPLYATYLHDMHYSFLPYSKHLAPAVPPLLLLLLQLPLLHHWGGSTFFRNAPTSAISWGTACTQQQQAHQQAAEQKQYSAY